MRGGTPLGSCRWMEVATPEHRTQTPCPSRTPTALRPAAPPVPAPCPAAQLLRVSCPRPPRVCLKAPCTGTRGGSKSSSRGKRRGGRREATSPGPVPKRSWPNTSPPAAVQLARLILGSPAQQGSFLLRRLSSPHCSGQHGPRAEPRAGRRSCCQGKPSSGGSRRGNATPSPNLAPPDPGRPLPAPPSKSSAAGWALARPWF